MTIVVLYSQLIFSQNYFQRALGDSMSQALNSIELSGNSDFIGAGYSYKDNPYSKHGWIAKFDKSGNIIWDKTIHRYGNEEFTDIIKSNSGDFYAIGKTDSMTTNKSSLMILKFNTNGDTIWTRVISSNESIEIKHIEEISSGGFIMTGSIRQSNTKQIVLMKMNNYGAINWIKYYGYLNYTQNGYCVKETHHGFVITGSNEYGAASNHLSGFMLVTDSLGNKLWDKFFHPKTNIDDDIGLGTYIIQCKDKGYVFGGNFYINNTSQTIIVKMDSLGNEIWHNYFSNIGGNPVSIIENQDSSIVILTSKSNLLKLNSDGTIVWSKTIAKGNAKDLKTKNDGFIYVGETNLFGNGIYDGLIVSTDENGKTYCSDSTITPIFDSTGFENNGIINFVGTASLYYLNDSIEINESYSSIMSICDTTIYIGNKELVELKNNVSYYPNPVTDIINVRPNFVENYSIRLINSMGKLIQSKMASGDIQLETSQIPQGLYIVEVISDKKRFIFKILKQ